MPKRPSSYRTTFYRNALDLIRKLSKFPPSSTSFRSSRPRPPPTPVSRPDDENHTYYRNNLLRALADRPALTDEDALHTLDEFIHHGITGVTDTGLRMAVRLDIDELFDGERRRVETVFRWLNVQQ